MRYVSTRGGDGADFTDVLLGGPAADGGLYLPSEWPLLQPGQIRALATLSYADVAYQIMRPFAGNAFSDGEFKADVDAAYASFRHKAVAPLVQMAENRFLLELFHGPTLAFKDVAMQLLGRLFARALAKQGRCATVIVATSGDTGSAAIAAFKGQANVSVVVLHPKGRVSEVQRRQMTTVPDANVHCIALEGSFDDCQSIVKALFADTGFSNNTQLTAVNSINFARIMAQCVYYFTGAVALGAGHGRPATFVVPTGNFGDIFAGEAAWRMGLPVERLIVATNANDILVRALTTGNYTAGEVRPTLSPSMDIQVASNFERALFEASNRDANWMIEAMRVFDKSRRLGIIPDALKALRVRYDAGSTDDAGTVAAIAKTYRDCGLVIDPHTAVAVAVADQKAKDAQGPVVILSTAHPGKFPDAVARAIGKAPEPPAQLAELAARDERYTVLSNDIGAVRAFVLQQASAR